MTRRTFWRGVQILCVVSSVACSTGGRESLSMSPIESPGRLLVSVASSEDSHDLQGAHVFILSSRGHVLTEANTDELGVARLRMPRANEEPAFVLVEHPSFFLGGMRWRPDYHRFREMYIKLALGAVP